MNSLPEGVDITLAQERVSGIWCVVMRASALSKKEITKGHIKTLEKSMKLFGVTSCKIEILAGDAFLRVTKKGGQEMYTYHEVVQYINVWNSVVDGKV